MKSNKYVILGLGISSLAIGVLATSSLLKPFEKADAVETFQVNIDMNGHGTSRWVEVESGKTVAQVIRDNLDKSEYTDGDYYLIGFNESRPLKTDEEGLDRFYRACSPFQNMQITRSMGLCAGWAKIPEEPNVFNKIASTSTSKTKKAFNVGEFYFSNMQIPSYWMSSRYDHYKVEVETSELVNVDDPEDKAEFDFYTNIYKTTDLTIGAEVFNIFENDEQIDNFFHKNGGHKAFVYIDGNGTAAEYSALGEEVSGKLVIVNKGTTSLQDKFNSAKDAGAESLLVINDEDKPLIMDIDETSGYCVGSLYASAAEALKEHGDEYEINGVTIYKGFVDIANKRVETGIPYTDGYRLNYGTKGCSEHGSVYIQIKNPETLTPGATYEMELTYGGVACDSGNDFTQAGLCEGESTIVKFHVKDVTPPAPDPEPDTPDNPVEPDKPTPAKRGLPAGAIVGIVIGSVLIVGLGGFAIFWFVIKKKSFQDLINVFKKKK